MKIKYKLFESSLGYCYGYGDTEKYKYQFFTLSGPITWGFDIVVRKQFGIAGMRLEDYENNKRKIT